MQTRSDLDPPSREDFRVIKLYLLRSLDERPLRIIRSWCINPGRIDLHLGEEGQESGVRSQERDPAPRVKLVGTRSCAIRHRTSEKGDTSLS